MYVYVICDWLGCSTCLWTHKPVDCNYKNCCLLYSNYVSFLLQCGASRGIWGWHLIEAICPFLWPTMSSGNPFDCHLFYFVNFSCLFFIIFFFNSTIYFFDYNTLFLCILWCTYVGIAVRILLFWTNNVEDLEFDLLLRKSHLLRFANFSKKLQSSDLWYQKTLVQIKWYSMK